MITQETIDQLRSRIILSDLIGQYVKLKKNGSNYVACCPFHEENTPSFTVTNQKDLWKCFGCGKSGDGFAFLMEHKKYSFLQALQEVAQYYHFKLELSIPVKNYIKPQLKPEKVPDDFIKWFAGRKISLTTLQRFNITSCIEWMPKIKREVRAICFNYYRNNELINIKYRAADKDFKLAKDAELIFYNLDALHGNDTAIIVEGEVDCLTLHECGIHNVVSVPNGAGTGVMQLQYLDNCWQYFEDKTKIILMVDNDGPGYTLREELARRLGKHRCFKISWPDDCKDANDILVKYGRVKVLETLNEPIEWPIEGVMPMADMIDDVLNFYENGYPVGVKTGIEPFDNHISFMAGQFTTVTGIPGSGKSEFVDYIMTSLATHHEWPFAICSFENQPNSLHVTKLMEKFSGKSFAFRKNIFMRMNKQEMEHAIYKVDKYFHFININQVDVTLDGILAKAEELVLRKGIKGLLIDPWNYIEHKIPTSYTETQYISESLTKLKAFCLKNGVHAFLVAHPTKLQKSPKTGKYDVPTMYSISGSAHFFNKTDNGITVYRDFETGIVDIYIQKIRYSWLGKIGFCSFNFDLETRQYVPI